MLQPWRTKALQGLCTPSKHTDERAIPALELCRCEWDGEGCCMQHVQLPWCWRHSAEARLAPVLTTVRVCTTDAHRQRSFEKSIVSSLFRGPMLGGSHAAAKTAT